MALVYRYRTLDRQTGDWVVELSKGTEERIKELGGRVIDGTREEVDSARIDAGGRYIPAPEQPN